MKKIILLSIATMTILSGCSKTGENSSLKVIYDESSVAEENKSYMSKIAGIAEKNSDTITLPIKVDENNNITDVAEVKLISATYETNTINNFNGFNEYWQTIYHYDEYFNEDGTLKPEYAFAEVTVDITSDNRWEEINLTDFKLSFMSLGEYHSAEPRLIDKCVDFNNPHNHSAISLEAKQPKTIMIGYIVKKDVIENIDEAYLNACFASFDKVDGRDCLTLSFKKYSGGADNEQIN